MARRGILQSLGFEFKELRMGGGGVEERGGGGWGGGGVPSSDPNRPVEEFHEFSGRFNDFLTDLGGGAGDRVGG